jgi:ribosomal protein S18 acetylase RimI-like enzyme
MDIVIRQADNASIRHLKTGGSAFEVRSKLVLRAEKGSVRYTVVDVPPYTKEYDPEEVEPESYVGAADKVVFFAWLGEEVIGQIRLRRYWNGYAYIDDIAVEPEYRGEGIGRALMARAIAWAKEKGLPGLMLETQDNNVPACRLYARCGFQLRGFDTHLYKGLDASTDEIALFWYLMF